MCFRVDCKQCGKHTWGGCGKHLATVYANIDEGKHCMCRPWPGVEFPHKPYAIATHQQLPPSSGSSPSGQEKSKQVN